MNVNSCSVSFTCLIFIALLGHGKQPAATVTSDKGNIVYVSADGLITRLTNSGRDREPALHPDGEWIYFIRSFEGRFVEETYILPTGKQDPSGKMLQEELWRVRRNGTESHRLYQDDIAGPCPNAEHEVASLGNIQFSPDGALIYFELDRWTTSSELWVVDKDGKNRHALGFGNGTRIVQESTLGKYRGFIVTSQHRYFVFGGSYDWYYLFTPDMKKMIGAIGESIEKGTNSNFITFVPTHRSD